MKKIVIALLAVFSLTACNQEYIRYADTQRDIAVARANAEGERYKAMAQIAQSGDSVTKVAAMFAMQQPSQQYQQQSGLAAPKNGWDTARDWLGLVLPTAVQAYGINANKLVSITQSNNTKDVAVSTNQAFVGIASQIQAPAANVTNTLSGSGVLGSGTYSTTTTADNHTINPTNVVQLPPGRICSVDPVSGVLSCQ